MRSLKQILFSVLIASILSFANNLQAMKEGESYKHALKRIVRKRNINSKNQEEIIKQTESWALKNNQKLLDESYCKLIDTYASGKPPEKVCNNLKNIFERYHKINKKKQKRRLKPLSNFYRTDTKTLGQPLRLFLF